MVFPELAFYFELPKMLSIFNIAVEDLVSSQCLACELCSAYLKNAKAEEIITNQVGLAAKSTDFKNA